MRVPKDLQKIAKVARKQGWVIELTNGGHIVFTSPAGQRVITGSTPSEYRGHHNTVARLRRAGLKGV